MKLVLWIKSNFQMRMIASSLLILAFAPLKVIGDQPFTKPAGERQNECANLDVNVPVTKCNPNMLMESVTGDVTKSAGEMFLSEDHARALGCGQGHIPEKLFEERRSELQRHINHQMKLVARGVPCAQERLQWQNRIFANANLCKTDHDYALKSGATLTPAAQAALALGESHQLRNESVRGVVSFDSKKDVIWRFDDKGNYGPVDRGPKNFTNHRIQLGSLLTGTGANLCTTSNGEITPSSQPTRAVAPVAVRGQGSGAGANPLSSLTNGLSGMAVPKAAAPVASRAPPRSPANASPVRSAARRPPPAALPAAAAVPFGRAIGAASTR